MMSRLVDCGVRIVAGTDAVVRHNPRFRCVRGLKGVAVLRMTHSIMLESSVPEFGSTTSWNAGVVAARYVP
jgi:hypothetical protein